MADQKVLSTGIPFQNLPENYIRPESERPRLSEVISGHNIPLIDLGSSDRAQIICQIGEACESHGFFQVLNHGITADSTSKMLEIAHEFFRLPLEKKMEYYSDDPSKKIRLSTSFNVKKEKIHNWRDYLRLHCYPLEEFVEEWPSTPPSFKVNPYSLWESKGLNLRDDSLVRVTTTAKLMVTNFTTLG